jgi:NAD-dependent SIR2 family protein deacetylase
MPKGRCEKCGHVYYGWALKAEKAPHCVKCGGKIRLEENAGTDEQESDPA